MTLQVCFWLQALTVLYAYAGYPLLLALLGRLRKRPVHRQSEVKSLSVVIAARNEQATIPSRISEFITALDRHQLDGEVIIVSDGSTDGTADAARREAARLNSEHRVQVLELPRNLGKAAALNVGCARASKSYLVFADARQTWGDDALVLLLENFSDKSVGAVSGDLVLSTEPGVMEGVSLYWKYERWIRNQESLVSSTVGVTGAISAVRRELFQPLPAGVVLDDVYWPMCVAMQGYRVVRDERAKAFDRLPPRARDEFQRKVRTLSGSFQLVQLLPDLLLPSRNPLWIQFVSHKLLRLLVPWLMLSILATNSLLPAPFYRGLLLAQLAGYAIGICGLWPSLAARSRLLSAAGSFLVLNAAAGAALWVWLTGNTSNSWKRTAYQVDPIAATSAE
jgi:poly-beta-1,6-N-acetyl-D-glucosamine synthase